MNQRRSHARPAMRSRLWSRTDTATIRTSGSIRIASFTSTTAGRRTRSHTARKVSASRRANRDDPAAGEGQGRVRAGRRHAIQVHHRVGRWEGRTDARKRSRSRGDGAAELEAAAPAPAASRRRGRRQVDRDRSSFDEHARDLRLLVEQIAVGDDQVRRLSPLDRTEAIGHAGDGAAPIVIARSAASALNPALTAFAALRTKSFGSVRPADSNADVTPSFASSPGTFGPLARSRK